MKAAKLGQPVNTFLVTLLPPSDEDILLKDLPTDEPTLVRLTWESVRLTGVSGAPWVLLSGLLPGCTTVVPSLEKSTATWLGNVGRDGWRGALPVLGVAEFSACFNKAITKSPEYSLPCALETSQAWEQCTQQNLSWDVELQILITIA